MSFEQLSSIATLIGMVLLYVYTKVVAPREAGRALEEKASVITADAEKALDEKVRTAARAYETTIAAQALKNSALEDRINEVLTANDRLASDYQIVSAANTEWVKVNAELRADNSEHVTTIESQRIAIEQLTEQGRKQDKQLTDQSVRMDKMESDLRERDTTIRELQTKLGTYENTINPVMQRLGELLENVAAITTAAAQTNGNSTHTAPDAAPSPTESKPDAESGNSAR